MPQVWLTYDEFGDFLGVGTAAGRSFADERGLARRVSRDGLTRLKLSPDLAETFMIDFTRQLDAETAGSSEPVGGATTDLRMVAELLEATRAAGIDLADVLTKLLRDVGAKAVTLPAHPMPIEKAG
jgi:hypothetical protein